MRYIITADWHLRSQKPRCRLDDNWMETQKNALRQIACHAKEHEADVIVIGDIFHSTNETTNEIIGLVQEFAKELGENELSLYILAGNHDLPQHNIENIHRAAFSILLNSRNIFHVSQIPDAKEKEVYAPDFGLEEHDRLTDAEIVFRHILCFPENEKLPPGAKAVKPSELFLQSPNAQCIFTGDYHRQFVYQKNKKILLNPGCLLRQAADMLDYKPAVFLIYFSDDTLTYASLPIIDNEKLVTDEYLETEKLRNYRIEAFIERIKENESVTFDFIENVHTALKDNTIDVETKNTILELMENT